MIILKLLFHRVQPPLSAGVEPPAKFSKSGGGGGLDRTSSFKGGCWERGGDLSQGGCKF